MVQYSDFDVEPLQMEDFPLESDGPYDTARSQLMLEQGYTFIHQTRLAELLAIVHTHIWRSRRVDETKTGFIASREAARTLEAAGLSDTHVAHHDSSEVLASAFLWYSNLPPELQYDVDDVRAHKFGPAYLHIFFL